MSTQETDSPPQAAEPTRCCGRSSRTCTRGARRSGSAAARRRSPPSTPREKLTARERLALLIDDGTFVELGIHGRPHFSQRAMDGRTLRPTA